jgi:hypothetical protein
MQAFIRAKFKPIFDIFIFITQTLFKKVYLKSCFRLYSCFGVIGVSKILVVAMPYLYGTILDNLKNISHAEVFETVVLALLGYGALRFISSIIEGTKDLILVRITEQTTGKILEETLSTVYSMSARDYSHYSV